MFAEAKVCILNKIDLIPYTNFKLKNFKRDVLSLNPNIHIFQVSALNGEGMDDWYRWLKDEAAWKTRKVLEK